MVAKVIVDRKIKKGNKSEFFDLLKELRSKTVTTTGYISGETLRALSDPHNSIVISTWQSVDDWKNWEQNAERKKIQAKNEKRMLRPTKTKIYVHA